MQADEDVSGFWWGRYHYAGGSAPSVSFLAVLVENGGGISGSTSEANFLSPGGGILRALVRGARRGREVEFVKAYDGESDAAHAIDYRGVLDATGTRIDGFWRLVGHAGDFEMHRTRVGSEAELAEPTDLVAMR